MAFATFFRLCLLTSMALVPAACSAGSGDQNLGSGGGGSSETDADPPEDSGKSDVGEASATDVVEDKTCALTCSEDDRAVVGDEQSLRKLVSRLRRRLEPTRGGDWRSSHRDTAT